MRTALVASPAFTKTSSFRCIPSNLVTRSDTSSRRKNRPGMSSLPISPINGSSFDGLLIVCGSLMASAKCHQVKIEQMNLLLLPRRWRRSRELESPSTSLRASTQFFEFGSSLFTTEPQFRLLKRLPGRCPCLRFKAVSRFVPGGPRMASENWARQYAVKTEPVTELRADAII